MNTSMLNPMSGERVYHLSCDDVFASLIEVSDQKINLFEHPFFSFLQSIHKRFGIHIDLYLFAEGEVLEHKRTLGDLTEQLRTELSEIPWIHFGPHALNYETRPFDQSLDELVATFNLLYQHIDRLSGETTRSNWLRLHYFSECFEAIPYLRDKGVDAIFLTDQPAVSYRLPAPEIALLEKSGSVAVDKMLLLRSFQRIESLVIKDMDDFTLKAMLSEHLDEYGYVALFTHETDIADPDVRDLVYRSLVQLESLGASPK